MTVAAPRSRLVLRVLWRLHRFWFAVSGGRIGSRVGQLPVLRLTTTGHRSGGLRSVMLNFVEDPRGFIVFGSNGGAETHPAWWRNLEASPRAVVRVGRSDAEVVARELEGTERERAWASVVLANPNYEDYRKATTRRIPVVLLERPTH